MRKVIIISGVNIIEGGPLSIFEDCLKFLSKKLSKKYRIIALVHNKNLFNVNDIEYIEFKKSRTNWFIRLYYEYFYFYFISIKIKPYLWFSLHDITPNVRADIKVVYCHNPSPFYTASLKTFYYDYKVGLFSIFYKYLYAINIKKNNYVVVQQAWIRNAFREMYDIDNVVVAYPEVKQLTNTADGVHVGLEMLFLYPAFPRVFKNIEVIAEAAKLLSEEGFTNFKIILTFSGDENRYASYIRKMYAEITELSFIGIKTRAEIYSLYRNVNLVIFPSSLETWGLPISEAKSFNLPILLADLPYAHETVGEYEKVKFFNHMDSADLAEKLKLFIDGSLVFDDTNPPMIEKPFAKNWEGLFNEILSGNNHATK